MVLVLFYIKINKIILNFLVHKRVIFNRQKILFFTGELISPEGKPDD